MLIYNSSTHRKEDFQLIEEGKVRMYVCGPTVYDNIHIGNARTFISFDVIRRWLIASGYEVTFAQNLTDVDDKIINREAIRLELSIAEAEKTGLEPVAFLHYPPLYGENTSPQILDVLARHSVRRCYYGHIHAAGCRWAFEGERRGIFFSLGSSDYLHFDPLLVEPGKKTADFSGNS